MGDDIERRALRPLSLAQTRAMLTYPAKRPQEPYGLMQPHPRDRIPGVLFQLDEDQFARNFRSARKGGAAGLSGKTTADFDFTTRFAAPVQIGMSFCQK